MGKFSEIDLIIQDIKNYLRNMTLYIIIALIISMIGFLMCGKELNNVEARLTKQEQYMHEVQAEIDNLKEVYR
jgi:hypothetical protein